MSDIFTNQSEAIQGIRDSAAAVGLDPDKVMRSDPQFVMVAKKNCGMCWGQGTVYYTPSPSKQNPLYNSRLPQQDVPQPILSYCKCTRKIEV
jgi:hypothetical protein